MEPFYALDTVDWLLKLVRRRGLFKRRGTPIRRRVKACLPHLTILSYREIVFAARVVSVSQEAVGKWVKRLQPLNETP